MNDVLIRKIFSALASERGRRTLHRMQDSWLRQQIQFTAQNSPFYRQKFSDHNIDPKTIKRAADLPKLGFFTRPVDLQEDPYQFLAVPREGIVYAMSSSGTTGKSKTVFLTKKDWEIVTRTVGNGLTMMGMTSADVAQILFCYGTPAWMTGTVLQNGLERTGAFVLPTGNSISIEKQVEIIQQFGSTVLLGTPSYLHRLTEEAKDIADLKSFGIRLIRLGAEPWSDSLRSYLESAWGAQVYDSYGMMELGAVGAGECKAHDGLHLTPYLIVEVIDPQSEEPLPPGELGELVYTTLRREGSPLLRYRSGDLGWLMPDELCACGELPTDRISRIVGRSDDMLFLGSGENAFPAQFESALMGLDGLMGFQVVIDKRGFQDQITIRIESSNSTEALKGHIQERLFDKLPFLEHEIYQSKMIAPLQFEFLSNGKLHNESPVKLRHLVDQRN